jgi:hypothetical protein
MFCLCLIFSYPAACSDSDKAMQFICHGKSYEVHYEFETEMASADVLAVIHEFEHLRQYMDRLSLKMTLVSASDICTDAPGSISNTIRYDYTYLIFTKKLTLKRVMNPDSGFVTFNMIHAEENSKLIPSVKATWGRYDVHPSQRGCRVTYIQKTEMDRSLNRFYGEIIRLETQAVLKSQFAYIRSMADKKNTP